MPLIKDRAAELAHVDQKIKSEEKLVEKKRKAKDEALMARLEKRQGVLRSPIASDHDLDVASAGRSVGTVVVSDYVEGWADAAIEETRKAVVRRLDGTEEALALVGVAALKKVSGPIARRGTEVVAKALASLVSGDADTGRTEWVVGRLSFDDRRRAMRDATIFAVAEADQVEADWEEFKAEMLKAGEAALSEVLPFVLAVFGL